jgi:hypothetical protein
MSKKTSDDYEVGKGKPPKNGQYHPGQSGNPNGRPKGSKNVHEVLSKILKEKITITDAGNKMVVEKLEGAMRVLVNKSFEGRPQSLKLLIDLLKDAESVGQTASEGSFTDDDCDALMEELDWLDVVRNALVAEMSDGPE